MGTNRRGVTFAILAMLLAGCTAKPHHPTAHLAGSVTIEGAPVGEGTLVLLPEAPGHGPAVGVSIVEGKYDCPAAPTGNVVAQIHALKPSGKMIEAMGKTFPELISIVPSADRGGVKISVVGDNLQQDFSLSSSAPRPTSPAGSP